MMIEKKVKIGFDRYLAKEWADYSLGLFANSNNGEQKYEKLKAYIQEQVSGSESARKTSNQLKRLWLNDQAEFNLLRIKASQIVEQDPLTQMSILHFGMAINVYPIFYETCKRLGELAHVMLEVEKSALSRRIAETFLNPSSIPRIVDRVLQTLENWGFVFLREGYVKLKEIHLQSENNSSWFIQALLAARGSGEISINECAILPEKMGIDLGNIRIVVQRTNQLAIRRNGNGEEIIFKAYHLDNNSS
jgi:hypothetical protein